jgi:hypothetical protein
MSYGASTYGSAIYGSTSSTDSHVFVVTESVIGIESEVVTFNQNHILDVIDSVFGLNNTTPSFINFLLVVKESVIRQTATRAGTIPQEAWVNPHVVTPPSPSGPVAWDDVQEGSGSMMAWADVAAATGATVTWGSVSSSQGGTVQWDKVAAAQCKTIRISDVAGA